MTDRGVHRATLLGMRAACQRLVGAGTTGTLTGARLECVTWMLRVTEPGAVVTMPRNGEFHRATAKRWAADLRRTAQKLTRSRQIVQTRIDALRGIG